MSSLGEDQPVTLRDIYRVGVETREQVIDLNAQVGELRRLRGEDREDLDETMSRVSTVEQDHAKISGKVMGAALASSAVASISITIIGWLIVK